jgi:hypothetical protein
MEFDVLSFGYGAGLVMLPYIVGMVIGMIHKSINAIQG